MVAALELAVDDSERKLEITMTSLCIALGSAYTCICHSLVRLGLPVPQVEQNLGGVYPFRSVTEREWVLWMRSLVLARGLLADGSDWAVSNWSFLICHTRRSTSQLVRQSR